MGAVGDVLDSAMAESWFTGGLRTELLGQGLWLSTKTLGTAIVGHTRRSTATERRHSALGHPSLDEYERLMANAYLQRSAGQQEAVATQR
jgi:transposase InsO family protein